MAGSPSLVQQGSSSNATSTPSSLYTFGGETLASTHHAASTAHFGASTTTLVAQPAATSYTAGLSGPELLRNLFRKRLHSIDSLKRSLQSKQSWFQAIDLAPEELASAFDSHRMRKRTLRYMLFGLSLSTIFDLSQPSDMARAIISLVNELDSHSDDALVALTSGAGGPSNGAQRAPKVRNFFKTGTKTIKRSAATQAISEFGGMDSTPGPASNSDQTSYLMTPNLPFQLDFFQTFYTLSDMLTEIYYKMLAFLPKDAESHSAHLWSKSTPSSSGAADHNQTFFPSPSENAAEVGEKNAVINAVTQELLLKADAKIKRSIHQQIKEIDVLARQMIKHELTSLDPLHSDLDSASAASASAFLPNVGNAAGNSRPHTPPAGLPSGSSLPYSMNSSAQPPFSASSSNLSFANSGSIPSAFRPKSSRAVAQDAKAVSESTDHHNFDAPNGAQNVSPEP